MTIAVHRQLLTPTASLSLIQGRQRPARYVRQDAMSPHSLRPPRDGCGKALSRQSRRPWSARSSRTASSPGSTMARRWRREWFARRQRRQLIAQHWTIRMPILAGHRSAGRCASWCRVWLRRTRPAGIGTSPDQRFRARRAHPVERWSLVSSAGSRTVA